MQSEEIRYDTQHVIRDAMAIIKHTTIIYVTTNEGEKTKLNVDPGFTLFSRLIEAVVLFVLLLLLLDEIQNGQTMARFEQ